MTIFADELQAGIDEAARKAAEARLDGDDYCAEAYRERLSYLRHVARRHGVELLPRPRAGTDREPACSGGAELVGRKLHG